MIALVTGHTYWHFLSAAQSNIIGFLHNSGTLRAKNYYYVVYKPFKNLQTCLPEAI